MSSYELGYYRLTSEKGPSKALLSAIMEEAAMEAKAKNERASKECFDQILQQTKDIPTDIPVLSEVKASYSSSSSSTSRNPYLIVVAGPNGSGKTTLTSQMLKHQWFEDAVYINPDNVAQQKFGDWNSAEAILKAARYCVTLREDCLSNKKSLVVETVLSTPRSVDFVERAIVSGYYVRLFFVATSSPTINASRVALRVMEGGHDVPISKITSRYPKSIANCKLLANMVDQLYVIDNSVDGQPAQLLFQKAHGTLEGKYVDEVPLWSQAIL